MTTALFLGTFLKELTVREVAVIIMQLLVSRQMDSALRVQFRVHALVAYPFLEP